MKVLLLGSGGREHALGWKLSQSRELTTLIVAPGNDAYPSAWIRWKDSISNHAALEALTLRAKEEKVDFVVVGPDNALSDGAIDAFTRVGIPGFGPRQAAAKIESSKSFAKEIMKAAAVPTAEYWSVNGVEDARKLVRSLPWSTDHQWVIKADGLALGKGVWVCAARDEALAALESLQAFGGSFVIERRLSGRELSWFAICNGEQAALLDPACDYKRLGDDDQGPNTGGMGAYSPVDWISPSLEERVRREVFTPVLQEMKKRGTPFQGLLYAGLMLSADGTPWVLEFNARFGDPETQALLPRLDEDLLPWLQWSAGTRSAPSSNLRLKFVPEKSVYVVAAAEGYPDAPVKGAVIPSPVFQNTPHSIPQDSIPQYFFAGVERQAKDWCVSGGRVLGSLGLAKDWGVARAKAYTGIEAASFANMQFRKDIARDGGVR